MLEPKNTSIPLPYKCLKSCSCLLMAVILIILFFHPAIFSDKTFYFRDIHRWFYPMKYFLASSLKMGSIPYWISSPFCGTPFISDIQSGMFYPLSLVFILFPYPFSFNLFILLHFFLGFCFFYLFIRELGLSQKSALITGISFCYGGYTISSINTLNNLSTLIWLPAILWAYKRARAKDNHSWYFLTIIFLCLAILGGEPQLFILTCGLLLFYSLLSTHVHGYKSRKYIITSTIILFLVLSAILLSAIQLGMTYMDYRMSARLGGITYEEASRYSLEIDMLKHLFLPIRFDTGLINGPDPLKVFYPGHKAIPWLLTVYPGILILPAALIGVFFSFSRKIIFWLLIFFITLVLAMGNNTPLHFIFYRIFPFFRFPTKFIFLANFSLLIIAAHGINRLFYFLRNNRLRSRLAFSFLLLVMIIDLYSAHRDINPLCKSDFYQYHHPYLQPVIDDPETFRIYSDPETESPPSVRDTILGHHIKWQMMLIPNLGILQGISHVDGVPALELRYQYLITEILLKPWREKINFLKLANVKYIISSERLDNRPGLSGRIERLNGLVYRIKGYLPRAWLVGELRTIDKGTVEDLLHSSFNPAFSALTKGDIINRYNKPFFKDVDKISYEKNGRIHIELNSEAPGILVLSESSYPGWKVYVDGEEKECLWLNLLFQGVEIGKGKHVVDFIYRPKYFKTLLFVSLFAISLFFIIWFYCLLSVKKSRLKL